MVPERVLVGKWHRAVGSEQREQPTQASQIINSSGNTLANDLKQLVRDNLAKHEVPRLIEFVTSLPLTTTGKIMRRTLRDQEIAKLRFRST